MTLNLSPAAQDALMRDVYREAKRRADMRRMASTRGVEFRGGNLAALSNHDAEMVLSGPAGTGKTRANLTYINDAMWTHPNLRVLIIRKVKADLAETALVTYERDVLGFDNPICQGATRQHRDAYRYPNGSMMVIAGMDRPGRVLSSEWDIIYVSEVNEISLDDWELLNSRLGRTLAYPHPQLRGDCNPDRPDHWLLHRNSLTMLYTTHKDNPAYYHADGTITELGTRYMSRLEALTGVRRERYLLGRWVMAEGAVYTQWDKGMHVIEPFDIPADWRRIRAIDFGYTNPFVCQWWAIDPDGRMYMYREIYKTQTLVEDHAARIKDLSAGERYQYTVADHDAEDRATLARHGIATVAANKKVLAGIQAVSERLTPAGDGKPRLFLFRNALVDRDMNLEAGKQPVRTEDEFGGYVWNDKVRKEEPVKQDDHGCLVADTLVLTARGNVRITDVHIGDLVMTRAGWRRVVDAGMTAEAAKVLTVFLSDGSMLTGTGNHPVYVRGSGYSRLDALRYGDIIMRTENITGAIPCLSGAQLLRKSNLTGSSIGVILNRSNGQIGCTSRPDTWIGNAASSDCIKRFGKRLTGLFLSAMRFIMLTATRLTTIRATSIVSLAPSTSIFTENVSAMNAWNSCATQWITRENTRVYGTDLTQVAHGTQNMVAQRGRIESRLNTHVNNAEENTKRWPRAGKGAFARTNAKPRIGAQAELTMRTARVSDAVRCSGSTDIQNNDIAAVHVVAVVTNAKPSAVYNLTVEGMHEYFANGILVHNCDAARYAVMAVNSRVAPQLAANPFYGHGG